MVHQSAGSGKPCPVHNNFKRGATTMKEVKTAGKSIKSVALCGTPDFPSARGET